MITLLNDKQGRSKLPLLKSRLFWAGLSIKILLSFFFASAYLRDLFAPFVEYFVSSGFENPYAHFIEQGKGNEFPYPPMMLWLFSIPRIIFSPFCSTDGVLNLFESFVYRIPLLLADLCILFVLIRWLKTRMREVLVWYWLSPVLIYINYFHGQLDVLPIAVLFISLYFLFKQKWVLSFLFLAFAIGCKTNMVLVFPFYSIYLWRTQNMSWRKGLLPLALFGVVVFLINLPYLFSPAFISMVYNNPVQQQVFDLFYQFNGTLKIYFIPAIYFSLLIWYLHFKFVNRDQLILFLTFTFLALTLMVAPMQGWYYWIFPFLIYFAIKQDKEDRQLLILLNIFYFVYFGLVQNSDYLIAFNLGGRENELPFAFLKNPKALDITFTLLQTTLTFIAYLVFKKGIHNNIQTKFLSQPYLIGIGGDSAAGKSTLSNSLLSIFETQNTSVIRGDDMHKWERGNDNWNNFTHLDPRANKLHEDLSQAKSLKTGKGIKRSFYDHSTGKFTLPQFIKSNKLLIFEGLHSFYLKNHSDVYDLKIFMEPDENLRVWWKVKRDAAKRGYAPEQVLEQLKKREEDSLKYIRSQSENADMIVSFFSTNTLDPNDLSIEPDLGLKLSFNNNENLEALLEKIVLINTIQINVDYTESRIILTLKGNINSEALDILASQLIPELEEVGVYNAQWKEDYEGILQLFTIYIVFSRIKAN
ncbi:hypothetical protein [Aurantibacillus circumpalustris]|uniref:hypothetical protein n=1 Tax=Aurantibacillus circumpalustris TaxID=3036359 RepID=UPI00295AC124|nr:hypothetical protein [Aurantibacillus circumpalustris]